MRKKKKSTGEVVRRQPVDETGDQRQVDALGDRPVHSVPEKLIPKKRTKRQTSSTERRARAEQRRRYWLLCEAIESAFRAPPMVREVIPGTQVNGWAIEADDLGAALLEAGDIRERRRDDWLAFMDVDHFVALVERDFAKWDVQK